MRGLLFCLLLLSNATCQSVAQSPSDTTVIYCIGNSITQGSGLAGSQSYPSQLQQIGGTKIKVRNYGVSGATALNNGNKPYGKEQKYGQSLTGRADVIVIKLGTNDSKPANWEAHGKEFKNDCLALIRSYRKVFPGAKIMVLSPLPAWNNYFTIDGGVIARQVSPLTKAAALEEKCEFFDLAPFFNSRRECFPDGVHPDAEGARLLAEQVFARLKLLKWIG